MKRSKYIFLLIFACSLVAGLFCGHAFAGAEVGTATYVEGRVDCLRENTAVPVPLREGELIFLKDIIRTKSNSKAEITFKDKSILRLAQNSRAEISDYKLSDQGMRQEATINLLRGKARTIIAKMSPAADFNILTPNSQGSIQGSDVFAFFQAGVSGMLVSSGTLAVANKMSPQDIVVVPPGNSVVVSEAQVPKGPRPYLAMEKKFHEQDTNPPAETMRKKDLALIRGAVTKVSGSVKITPQGERKAHDAKINDMVGGGDTIETGADGKIELKFDNGNALSIKPGSKLVIVKLTADSKGNEYDNYFELSSGKIKATIEKLPAGATFRIKTPTAISGVRGTIMYADVKPNMTRVFFEGGPGFITSLESGETKEVGMGQTAFADDQGTVSEPVSVPAEERLDVGGEASDSEEVIDGYSPKPEGSSGLYLNDAATGVQNIADTQGGVGEETSNIAEENSGLITEDTSSQPQITETAPEILTPPAPPAPEPEPQPEPEPEPEPEPQYDWFQGNFLGHLGYFDLEYNDLYVINAMDGKLMIIELSWQDVLPLSLVGTYESGESGNDKLWISDYYRATDSAGNAFLGFHGGIRIDNTLEGFLYGFYVRKDDSGAKRWGYLVANPLFGAMNTVDHTFGAGGAATPYLEEATTMRPDQLNLDSSKVEFSEIGRGKIRGDISGASIGDSVNLTDRPNLVIWRMANGGTYSSLPKQDWQAMVGGIEHDPTYGNSYWIGKISGNSWQDGRLSATILGMALSDDEMGVVRGDLLGVYYDYESSAWEGLSAGIYSALPLQFSGEFDASFDDSSFLGLFGGTESLWLGTAQPVTLMGEFDNLANYVYCGHLSGETFDGGKFLGLLGGTKDGDTSKKLLSALYIRPVRQPDNSILNEAGYIWARDLSGNFYEDLGMFEDYGTVQAFPKQYTDYGTGSLYEGSPAIQYGSVNPAPVTGDGFSGSFFVHLAKILDQRWGILWMNGAGTYGQVPASGGSALITGVTRDSEDAVEAYWLGKFNVSWPEDNVFSATGTWQSLNFNPSRSLADFGKNVLIQASQIDMLGAYGNNSSWSAVGMGPYEETPLMLGATFSGGFGRYTSTLDFTSNPRWSTNNPTNYHWDSSAQTFYTNNYTNSGEFAAMPIDYDGGSFRLAFDLMAGSRDTGDVCVGLFGPTMESHARNSVERVFILMGGYNHEIFLEGTDQAGVQFNSEDYGNVFQDNTWYHFVLDYNAATKKLAVTVTTLQGDVVLSFAADIPGGFSSNLTNFGVSMNGTWATSGRWETAHIDNVENSLAEKDMMLDMSNTGVSGIIGGVSSPLSGPGPLRIIGEFNNPKNYALWATDDDIIGKTAEGGWFLGVMGGIKVNNSLKGLFGAFYISSQTVTTGEHSGEHLCGYLLSNDIAGTFYPDIGMFEAEGTITPFLGDYTTEYGPTDLNVDGPALQAGSRTKGTIKGDIFAGTFASDAGQIKDQNWGLWRAASGGTYSSAPATNWNAHLGGRMADPDTGALVGYAAGSITGGAWLDSQFSASFSGYSITSNGPSVFSGNGIGTYADGTWQMLGLGVTNDDPGLPFGILIGVPEGGQFNTEGGGEIIENSLIGNFLDIENQNWGIYSLAATGSYQNPTSNNWDIYDINGLTIAGNQDLLSGSWLGGITGTKWSNNELAGQLDAVWIALRRDGTLSGRKISGETDGTFIEVGEGSGTWQAVSAGEWVEVISVLEQENFTNDIIAVGQAANVPITEVYQSMLTGANGAITQMAMDTHLYDMDLTGTANGIWAAIIHGAYATVPTGEWSVTLNNGADHATLTGPAWSGGEWMATSVDGRLNGNAIFGQAAGTYGDGLFSGAGTGFYQRE